MLRKTIFTVLFLIVLHASSGAVTPEEILDLKTFNSSSGIAAGSEFRLALEVKLRPGWHINSNQPSNEFAVPTEVVLDKLPGLEIERVLFPPHIVREMTSAKVKTEIFEESFVVLISGRTSGDIRQGEQPLNGKIIYQGCDKDNCLPPAEKPFLFRLEIVAAGTAVRDINKEIFSGSGREVAKTGPGNVVARHMAEKGLLLTLVFIFFGGLALNLTPCVYPLIPITISYFGGQYHKGRGLLNASAYVLGIAVTYSSLGTAAAFSGSFFGALLTNPVTIVVMAGLMVALSLSMFGLYEIRVPGFLMNIAGGEARSGFIGALIMGMTMGIIAAPCIGPFVIGLLTYVATIGSPSKGFLMFFVLSLGLGFPYLFLGIFSGRISSLPRSGEWMAGVRKIFGIILIVMAVYFLNPLLGRKVYGYLFSASLIAGGCWLVIFDRTGEGAGIFKVVKGVVAVSLIISGTWMIKPEQKGEWSLQWKGYSEGLVADARRSGSPMVIDFSADWCIPCRELEEITFRDTGVRKYEGDFVFLKVDLSRRTEQTEGLKERYNIRGVPTIVFLRPDGSEDTTLRITGFEPADEFIRRLEKAKSGG